VSVLKFGGELAEFTDEIVLALLVVFHTNDEELLDDGFGIAEFGEFLVAVEGDDIGGMDVPGEIEAVSDDVLFHPLLENDGVNGDVEIDGDVGVILTEGDDKLALDHVFQEFLVTVGPVFDGKIGDVDDSVVDAELTLGDELALFGGSGFLLDDATETVVPRGHGVGVITVEQAADVVDDVEGTVVGDGGGETCADTSCAVEEDARNDGDVVVRLDGETVVILVLEEVVIRLGVEKAGDGIEAGEDVTSRGMILTT